LTRRAALKAGVGAGALAVTGCHGKTAHPSPTSTPTQPAPDAAALQSARAAEAELLAAYDAHIKTLPLHRRAPLQVERAIHATHLAALHGRPGDARSATPVDHLAKSLRDSAAGLRRAALGATDGGNAALLARIAASHLASQ
jgi:hypothetical protein